MELTRRFIFRGNASAIGGRLLDPKCFPDPHVASSLTVVGGRSTAEAKNGSCGNEVHFGKALTVAEGVFDNPEPNVAKWRTVPEDSMTTTTVVSADIYDVVIGRRPQLKVGRLRSELTSRSPAAGGEPSIRVGDVDKGVIVQGVVVNDRQLTVQLDVAALQQCDTRGKLVAAADGPAFFDRFDPLFFLKEALDRHPAAATGRLFESQSVIYCSIVRSIKPTDGQAIAGVKIDHNVVTVDNLGTFFFGEVLITSLSRRLTMLRAKLGSPQKGDLVAGESETNGMWYP